MWENIKHFTPDEFGDGSKMSRGLIYALDAFREYLGKPIIIHCGWEERETGFHPTGNAVDLHIQGLSVFDQFMEAQRFDMFTGIGLYPWWNNGGLHLDNRVIGIYRPRAIWGSTAPQKYVEVSKQFMSSCF